MLRTSIAAAAGLLVAAAGVLTVPAYADSSRVRPAAPSPAADATPGQAGAPGVSLDTARRVMTGTGRPRDPSPTVALRDLWMRRADLRAADRREAAAMLARPSDGQDDPHGFGYTVPSTASCNTRICIHYVTTTADAATPAWVAQSLATVDAVWANEVDSLGFRAPLPDGERGGNPLFDVYLKDLGGQFYGYCANETRGRGRSASGFCVLDNDFSTAQFPMNTPTGNLTVTAAHEFFHAIQYAYDYAEDPWMMESTATWMEERVASDVNDNRQYLPYGQLYTSYLPLDLFSQGEYFQYGNWIFWEYLSNRFGVSFVNKAWEEAGSLRGDGKKYSVEALARLLRRKGGLTKVYAQFAAANLAPSAAYAEGSDYEQPRVKRSAVLTKRRRGARFATRINHLASASYRFTPGKGTAGRRWGLHLRVTGPARNTAPAAAVTLHLRHASARTRLVRLNRRGDGHLRVSFDKRKVAAVSVTLVNASTRFTCHRRTYLACAGKPRDDKTRFSVQARVLHHR